MQKYEKRNECEGSICRTLVFIAEKGWRKTDAGQKSSYSNCMGWSQMLCSMNAYLEHGINLREGMYK